MTEVSYPPQVIPDIHSSSEPIRLLGAAPTPSLRIAPIETQDERNDNKTQQIDSDNITKQIKTDNESNTDSSNNEEESNKNTNPKLPFSSFSGPSSFNTFLSSQTHSLTTKMNGKTPPELIRAHSCPEFKYDDCREFDSFSGKWVDSKAQDVLISPWGVIRYPNNPKLRFEATYMGPNHLSVTFDKDPKRRKFVGKLNHECTLLIWSNDTKWAKKGSKHDPKFHTNNKKKRRNSKGNRSNSCLVQ